MKEWPAFYLAFKWDFLSFRQVKGHLERAKEKEENITLAPLNQNASHDIMFTVAVECLKGAL